MTRFCGMCAGNLPVREKARQFSHYQHIKIKLCFMEFAMKHIKHYEASPRIMRQDNVLLRSASHSGRFPGQALAGIYRIGRWVCPRVGLAATDRSRVFWPCRESNPSSSTVCSKSQYRLSYPYQHDGAQEGMFLHDQS
jgi:hypothetical protein